jgi:hypothetical protein
VVAVVGLVFALFTVGYILGVWTAARVFRQTQSAYEDDVPAFARTRVTVLGNASRLTETRR